MSISRVSGVVATARWVSPPQKMAANTTKPMAPVRWRTNFILPRSMNGMRSSAMMASGGENHGANDF